MDILPSFEMRQHLAAQEKALPLPPPPPPYVERPETTTPDPYRGAGSALHSLAEYLTVLAEQGLAVPAISVTVMTRDTTDDEHKIRTLDAIGRAMLGRTGETRKLHSGNGYHHTVHGSVGPVQITVFDTVTPPEERERQDEVERLRAELEEQRCRADAAEAELAETRTTEAAGGAR